MAKAYIGIGSNVGDRQAHLETARRGLASLALTELVVLSRAYETAPVGPVEQGMFLNAAACVETALSPAELLAGLGRIEAHAGRASKEARIHWGPRELDLDILFYDDLIINQDNLKVPHPQLENRWFVLRPLADIAPTLVHPKLGQTVEELLHRLEHRCCTHRPG